MNPLLLAGIANLGGGLIGGLFGRDRERRQRRLDNAYRKQLMALTQPTALIGRTNQFYQQFLNSPAFAQGQRMAAGRGNQLQNALGSSLAARGLGTSGIGSIARPLAQSAAGNMLGNLRTGAYTSAAGQAGQSIQNEMSALQALGPQQAGGALGQGIGGGIADFGNFLVNYYGSKTK